MDRYRVIIIVVQCSADIM